MVIINLGPTDHDELATVKLEASAGATVGLLTQRI
jgi:hypothetical protein